MKALGWILIIFGACWALIGIGNLWLVGDLKRAQYTAFATLINAFVYFFPGLVVTGLGGILVATAARRADRREYLVAIALAGLLAAISARAGERVELYDAEGRRTGYAIMDRETGRADLYDAKSRRLGYGKLGPASERLELFDRDGRRLGSGLLRVPSKER